MGPWLNKGVTQESTAEPTVTYQLAELAAASGVSARTIRYYQAEHLLPGPAKRGREAIYGDEHLERLALIGELRDRGLTLRTIRELVTSDHPTTTVSQWLDVDTTLTAPWSDDRPRTVSRQELVEQVRRSGGDRPGLIGELQAAGFVEQNSGGDWTINSPALLHYAVRLQQAHIDVDITARVRDLLRRRLAATVDDSVKLLVERTGKGFAGGATTGELGTAIAALRPIAREMSSLILAQEVERALAELIRTDPRHLARSVVRRAGT
jgi:DNA-binding transcriptional MerR regulator